MLLVAIAFTSFASVLSAFLEPRQGQFPDDLEDALGSQTIAEALGQASRKPPFREVRDLWRRFQAASLAALPSSPSQSFEKVSLEVLVVVNAGDDEATADRQERNINILTSNPIDSFKWAIFNYAGTDKAFRKKKWYSDPKIVVHHELREGCKPNMYAGLHTNLTSKFDYVWLLDEDIDLTFVGWSLVRRLLLVTRALILQPSVLPKTSGARASDIPELCFRTFEAGVVIAREEERTEVMTPLLSSKVWPAVLKRLVGNAKVNICHTDTFWDLMGYLGKIHGCGRTGPLVMNSAPVVHVDARTLLKDDSKCEGYEDCEIKNSRPISDEEASLMRNVCPGIPPDWMKRYGCKNVTLDKCTSALRSHASPASSPFVLDADIEELLKFGEGKRVGLEHMNFPE
eukprot:TRINITY_DN5674_c0_g1_i4.p1 TRINITY_DN5674_c0_g1~~TRINITY_DN5674_c0_g1_i4.p1  ORF type:complete len:419 (-),score=60.73 TRINITY_DN5674_c0_g1_i4:42-1241(-)